MDYGKMSKKVYLAKENFRTAGVEGKPGLLKEKKHAPLNDVVNQRYVGLPQKEIRKPLKSTTSVNEIIARTDTLLLKKGSGAQNQVVKREVIAIPPKTFSYSSRLLAGVIDVDKDDNDPMLVPDYVKDIMQYLMELEDKYAVSRHYLSKKHLITWRMRAVLVNWMAEVSVNFKFIVETFHLAVSVLDRYLERNPKIGKDRLQLVGTAAMFVAAKYEEMYFPDLSDYVYICSDLYTKQEILKMEMGILKRLDFSMGKPLSIHFLRRFNRVAKVSHQEHNLAKYLAELALFDYNLCSVRSSLIAAACCCVSVCLMNENEDPAAMWTPTMKCYTTYSFSDIKEVAAELCNVLIKIETSQHQAITTKYSAPAAGKISLSPKLRGPFIKKLQAIFSDQKTI